MLVAAGCLAGGFADLHRLQARAGWAGFARDLAVAWWLVAYLPMVAALFWLGSGAFGGRGVVPFGWDMVLVAAVAVGGAVQAAA